MAKDNTGTYNKREKVKGKASKKVSNNKGSKKYKKIYVGQGR